MKSFGEKVEAGWQAYQSKMLALPKEDIIDNAEAIAAAKFCREALTSRMLSQDMRDYLQQFKDPLEVVMEAWMNARDVDLTGEFNHVLWELQDKRDAEQDYEMEPEHQSQGPEQSM